MPFKKGESGNPAGRPTGRSDRRRLVSSLLEPEAPALIAKAVEMALAGDSVMLKACLDKLIPNSRSSRTVWVDGEFKPDASGLPGQIVTADAKGELGLEDARGMMELCGLKARVDEATELKVRLETLEEAYEQTA
ncbi:DUF5681 domain-containing protein [Pseudomonadota bacterium]